MFNPYLDELDSDVGIEEASHFWGGYRISNVDLVMEREWKDRKLRGTLPITEFRSSRVKRYSWAIPDETAIKTIATYGPVVEMGAGTGYWAWLCSQMGVDVVAYDDEPPTGEFPTPPEARKYTRNPESRYRWHGGERGWFSVQKGAPEVLRRHRDRTLLLVWPPLGEPMAAECLRYWRGDFLVYVGEGEWGCTADKDFHRTLGVDWVLIEEVDIPQWWGLHDRLFVYERKNKMGRRRPLP